MSELKELVNAPEMVVAFGKTYPIAKFNFGQMTQALEYIGPLAYLIKRAFDLPKDDKGLPDFNSIETGRWIVEVAGNIGPPMLALVSVATKEPTEWLEQQSTEDGLKVFVKVVQKNLSFFSQANLEAMTGYLNEFVQTIPQLGGEPSTS